MIDPVRLEIYKHLLAAIPEEMGVILRRGSYSPNIKERRDYSCALFDAEGEMIAQAAHIPVHLGSMPSAVKAAIKHFDIFQPGDVIILNDPFRGGTHLPDITMVSPAFHDSQPGMDHIIGFTASRAHHADVGGMVPGSMPVAREIYQEGLILPPIRLSEAGRLNQGIWDLILANVRTPGERAGDLSAQLAANQRGVLRLNELVNRYGRKEVNVFMRALQAYSERLVRSFLSEIQSGEYRFEDALDDDGIQAGPIPIRVCVIIKNGEAVVDFSGSAEQVPGSVNAVYAITLSAVYYAFRCLIGLDIPNNSGCFMPISVIAPEGTVVNAMPPAAVAGGNVETSQRIVDTVLGALAQACPDLIPAASQGTMNNLVIGGWDGSRNSPFTYYETIGGGAGALPGRQGTSAVHTHMTNTLNTPIEALEYAYPLRILRYEIRRGSGGRGKYCGGNGILRDIQLTCDAQVTLMADRRKTRPYGLAGGSPGEPGENCLIRNQREQLLPGKGSYYLVDGDIIRIRTPGGGGHGDLDAEE